MLNWLGHQLATSRTTGRDPSRGRNSNHHQGLKGDEETTSLRQTSRPQQEELDHDVTKNSAGRESGQAVVSESESEPQSPAIPGDIAHQGVSARDGEAGEVKSPPRSGVFDPASHTPPARRATAAVVCIANQKGGVGKTTTAISLAAALAEGGACVLLVDLDPQGNATTGLGLRVDKGDPSTYAVLIDGMAVSAATRATEVAGLDLLPSGLDLAGAEIELVPLFARESRLRHALEGVRDRYEVVIVDCPPTLGLLTVNALVAADLVLLPIQCEYYALEGVGQLMHTLDLVRRNLNEPLTLAGVVLTMYDGRTRLSQQVVEEVRRHFGAQVFRTVIPRSVRLSEAPSFGEPITTFDPASRGARAYFRLAGEFAERLGLRLRFMSPLERPDGDEVTFEPGFKGGAFSDRESLSTPSAGSAEAHEVADYSCDPVGDVPGGGGAEGSDAGPVRGSGTTGSSAE